MQKRKKEKTVVHLEQEQMTRKNQQRRNFENMRASRQYQLKIRVY